MADRSVVVGGLEGVADRARARSTPARAGGARAAQATVSGSLPACVEQVARRAADGRRSGPTRPREAARRRPSRSTRARPAPATDERGDHPADRCRGPTPTLPHVVQQGGGQHRLGRRRRPGLSTRPAGHADRVAAIGARSCAARRSTSPGARCSSAQAASAADGPTGHERPEEPLDQVDGAPIGHGRSTGCSGVLDAVAGGGHGLEPGRAGSARRTPRSARRCRRRGGRAPLSTSSSWSCSEAASVRFSPCSAAT